MRGFPQEQERSAKMQKNLASAFDLAEAMFNFWLLQEKDHWIAKSKLPPLAINLAMMLDVQACRLFRSVIEACRRCEAFSASILSRALFETILGDEFLLRKRVRIIVEPNGPPGTPDALKFHAKVSSNAVKRSRKHRLSREFRAKLSLAHLFFQDQERGIDRASRLPGNKRRAAQLKKRTDPRVVAEYEKEIGPEWSYILRHRPHTYSGLSVENLARAIHKKFLQWYETIYHFQSRAVHASDLLKHVDKADGKTGRPMFLSSDWQVYESLRAAITMFLVHIGILHKHIGFGPDVEHARDSFKRKFRRLRWTPETPGG
jgi:hypothetical protein